MAKGEGEGLFKDSPPTDDQHSDGEEGSTCWFTPRGRGRWRFARVERKPSNKWRVSRLTRSQSTAPDFTCCCCCGPRRRGSGDEETKGGSTFLLQKFSDSSSSSSLRVSPALSPLPVRTVSKMERDKDRRATLPIWQRRASMSPIKALDLRQRTS